MSKSNILVTGASGLIGSSFIDSLGKDKGGHPETKRAYSNLGNFITPSHDQMDITSRNQILYYVSKYHPEIIINFAAHRDANTAEQQSGKKNKSAWKVNVSAVKYLVEICKENNIFMIHISTDMIFSGSMDNKGPQSEDSKMYYDPSLLSWYGWTKLIAEREIINSKINAAIVRVANVTKTIYDPKLDYIGKIIWLYDNNKLYPLFNDQYLTVTYIPQVSEALTKLIALRKKGIYHIASSNVCTPHELAEYTLLKVRGVKQVVKSVSISKFLAKMPNRYPKYGGLDATRTNKILDLKPYTWQMLSDKFVGTKIL